MAMTVGPGRKGAIADINVTPMADVMIVLLIIFMVATPIIAGSPVRLPDSRHAATHAREGRAFIVVRAGVVAGAADVFVRVAPGVAYARVVDALDAARGAGAGRIGLVDEPARP